MSHRLLFSNAFASMPEGGQAVLSTSNCYIDRNMDGFENVAKGENFQLTMTDTGMCISDSLIELEKLDPETFNRVESYIKGSADAVRAVAKRKVRHCIERRVSQRRKTNDSDLIPDGLDRRTGLDRRVASG